MKAYVIRALWIFIRRCFSVTKEAIEQKQWELGLLSKRVTILPGCKATSLNKISFGHDVLISHKAFIQGAGGITFGSQVMVGPNVMFITTTHDKVNRASKTAPIEIEDGVWIGAGALILPGVTLGEGSVIGAGAVVTRNVARGTLVAGVPAKPIGRLSGSVADQIYFGSEQWRGQFSGCRDNKYL